MGLFVTPEGKTYQENVREAIANLNLFLNHSPDKYDNSYLLGFAEFCIIEAKKKYKNKEE